MGSISFEESNFLKGELNDNYSRILELNHNILTSLATNPEDRCYDANLPKNYSTSFIQICSSNYSVLFCFGHIILKSVSKNEMLRVLSGDT
jgi:hypothetical protein